MNEQKLDEFFEKLNELEGFAGVFKFYCSNEDLYNISRYDLDSHMLFFSSSICEKVNQLLKLFEDIYNN